MTDEQDASAAAIDLTALGQSIEKTQEGSAGREAYLERLRKQIKAGEYKVDAEALAKKLLEKAPEEVLPSARPDDDPPDDHCLDEAK